MADKKRDPMIWQDEFGIDPRSKANIRRNGKNAPQGIDWDSFLKGTAQKGGKPKTSLGLINDQQKSRKSKPEQS